MGKLYNIAGGACDEMQNLNDAINAYIKLEAIGKQSEADAKDIVEQCEQIKASLDVIMSIVSNGEA